MVGDAGVERRGRDGVDDGGVVGLLLVALAVRVDQQGDQAAEDGAAEPHGDHVEEVKVWKKRARRRRRAGVNPCQFTQLEVVIEAVIHMVMTACSAIKTRPFGDAEEFLFIPVFCLCSYCVPLRPAVYYR